METQKLAFKPDPCKDKYAPYIAISRDSRFVALATYPVPGSDAQKSIQIWRLPDETTAAK